MLMSSAQYSPPICTIGLVRQSRARRSAKICVKKAVVVYDEYLWHLFGTPSSLHIWSFLQIYFVCSRPSAPVFDTMTRCVVVDGGGALIIMLSAANAGSGYWYSADLTWLSWELVFMGACPNTISSLVWLALFYLGWSWVSGLLENQLFKLYRHFAGGCHRVITVGKKV